MKRSFSSINDQEDSNANKRIKMTENYAATAIMQCFEVDDLLGTFIKLILPDIKSLLNLTAVSKRFWIRFHSLAPWTAAGFSVYYYQNPIKKEEFNALLKKEQFPLDKDKIEADVASDDLNKNIGAVSHLSKLFETERVLDSVSISRQLLKFIEMDDQPTLQIASIRAQTVSLNLKEEFLPKLIALINDTKSRDVKFAALAALTYQFQMGAVHPAIAHMYTSNRDLIRGLISTMSTEGLVYNLMIACLRLLSDHLDCKEVEWSLIEPAVLPTLKTIVIAKGDDLALAFGALKNIVSGRKISQLKIVVEASNMNRFVDHLLSDNAMVSVAVLSLLHTIFIAGQESNELIDFWMQPKLFNACQALLNSSDVSIKRSVSLFLSCLMPNQSCIQRILGNDIFMDLVLKRSKEHVQCAVLLFDMFKYGNDQQRKELIRLGIVPCGASALQQVGQGSLSLVNTLDTLFTFSKENGLWQEVLQSFEENRGVEFLENLQSHESTQIYQAAFRVLEEHFAAEFDED